MSKIARNISPSELQRLRKVRWLGRTNLLYLCNSILGYKDVVEDVHGPILRMEQQFLLPSPGEIYKADLVEPGFVQYTPWMDPYDLPGGRRTLLLDPRGGLKCVKKSYTNPTIRRSDGIYVPSAYIKVGDMIEATVDEDSLEGAWTKVVAVEEQSPQRCYKIRFRSGRIVEVSGNHPFRQIDGWKNAEDLVVGDRIALRGVTKEPEKTKPLVGAELLGWMLGDGSFGNCQVTAGEPRVVRRVVELAEDLGYTCKVRQDKRSKAVGVTIRGSQCLWNKYGLRVSATEYCRSKDKFIPDQVFQASNADIAKVLYGLFMSDATASASGIILTSKSERLCRDSQRLLARLGIFGIVRSHWVTYKGSTRLFWNLRIRDRDHVERFVNCVGWGKTFRYDLSRKGNPNFDTVPREWRGRYGKYLWSRGERPKELVVNKSYRKYASSKKKITQIAEALGDPWLGVAASPSVVWDFVEAVEDIGEHPTIAIQTESRTINVSDIVTHNTTINCIAHLIQWILNFPQLSYLFVQSNSQKAEDVLKEIKSHFLYNETFRGIYPDYCPHKRLNEWGNRQEFLVPDPEGREKLLQRISGKPTKEPTCRAASIDKGSAGSHYDVIKFSDIVEPTNVKTEQSIKDVIYNFRMMENLLVRPDGWLDVEGTRYHFSDLYGELIDRWKEDANYRKMWRIHVRSCYLRDFGDREPEFTPDNLDLPFVTDKDGKNISWWPQRFTYEQLEAKRADDSEVFATQQLNDPIQAGTDAQAFPLASMNWISADDFSKNVIVSHYQTTVDTADTVDVKSNFSCITTCAWDRMGKCFVVDVRLGKWLPDTLIENILSVVRLYRPQKVVVEETSFVRGIKQSLRRKTDISGIFVPIEFVKRENTQSKQERILNTLQPAYRRGDIVFLKSLVPKDHIMKELSRFPKWGDDFLDTLADQWQNKEWFGQLVPGPQAEAARKQLLREAQEKAFDRWIGFADDDAYDIQRPW